MKTLKKISLFTIVIIFLSSSCDKTMIHDKEIQLCNANNPLTDLPWLKAKIDSSNANLYAYKIYVYSHKLDGVDIFELTSILHNEPTNSYFVTYFNCKGVKLCSIESGFIYTSSCSADFSSKLTSEKLIYKK